MLKAAPADPEVSPTAAPPIGMRPAVAEATLDLAASIEQLWPLLTDTDRTNRLTGGGPLSVRPVDDPSKTSARFIVSTRAGGFDLEYEEPPFEWVYGRSFSVVRTMRGGPIASYTYRLSLEPKDGGGTIARLRLEIAPRYLVIWLIASWQAKRVLYNLCEVARSLDAHVAVAEPSPYRKPASAPDEARIARGGAALIAESVPEEVVGKITDLLRSGADADIVRMRPFELAALWGCDKIEVLRGFLKSVPAGLVELRWSLVCPSCLTSSQDVERLADVSLEGHCQLCDIAFDLDLDRAVEATFVPHPGVREVTSQLFCVGGPARTPHVMSQVNLPPGAVRTLVAPDEPARYRIFVRGGRVASCLVEDGAPSEVAVELTTTSLSPADVRVAPGGVVRVKSALTEPVHAKLERLGYATEAATAHVVATLAEFRRLFSTDILKRGTPLKVSHVALLFSDLTGSTALYNNAGDAAAFRLVDDHFDVLKRCIEEGHGTVVKTMGDAVMAAFQDPGACVAAAIHCLEAFETFRKTHPYGAQTGLKLGLFAGPCYVVSANGALDYFGQTVNVASRLQHLAESGEIIVPSDALDGVESGQLARVETVEARDVTVKGVEAPIPVLRLRLPGHQAG